MKIFPGFVVVPMLLLLVAAPPAPAQKLGLQIESLLNLSAEPDAKSLLEMLLQLDGRAKAFEDDADVKCWTSLGQLETFVAGAEFTPQATHRKSEVVINYLEQIWLAAATESIGSPSISGATFDAVVDRILPIETIEYKQYRFRVGDNVLEIPYQDVLDYDATVEPLRLLRTTTQKVLDIDPERIPLSTQAIDSAAHVAAVLGTAILKQSNVAARSNRHERISEEDVATADAQLAGAAGLKPMSEAQVATKEIAPDAGRRAIGHAAMLKIIEGKIESLNTFNINYSRDKLGETFDADLARLEELWAGQPLDPKASRLYKEKTLVDLAELLYRECAEQHPNSEPLTGPEMLSTLSGLYPVVTEFYGSTNLFPDADNVANVWVPEYLGDGFRDSGWHWRALDLAIARIDPKTRPAMDHYAMEELTEFLSIYAIALLRASGAQAEATSNHLVTVALLNKAHQTFEKNRNQYRAAPKSEPVAENRAEWEAGAKLARGKLRQSFVEEFYSDATADSGIDFVYEESDQILRTRFPESMTKSTSQTIRIAPGNSKVQTINPDAPVMDVGIAGGGVAVADVDGDGLLDIYLVSGKEDRLYRNLGNLRFEDKTETAGLQSSEQGRGAYFIDYDNDGDADLFVTRVYSPSRLFQNQGDGTFIDVTRRVGLPLQSDRITHSATWFDYDNDGNLDLYIGNFGNWLGRTFPRLHHSRNGEANQLFRNTGDGQFEDVTEATHTGSVGWTHAVSHFDANGDGYQDLYLANDFGRDELLINIQGERFLDFTPKEVRERSLHGMSVGFTDANDDGIEDIYVSNIAMFSFVSKYIKPGDDTEMMLTRRTVENARIVEDNSFLVSEKASFSNRQRDFFDLSEYGNGWAWDADFFDFDNDGHEDLYVANGREPHVSYDRERNVLYRQVDGRFYDVSRGSGTNIAVNSRGVVAADFDLDGDLDLIINNYRAPATLLRNNLRRNNWIRLELQGTRSNRDAIGARAVLYTKQGRQMRTVRGGSGFLSQEPLALSFGLGDATQINRLEIQWPSGTRQVLKDLPVNQVHKILESPAN